VETKRKAAVCCQQRSGGFTLNSKSLQIFTAIVLLIFLTSFFSSFTRLGWGESKYADLTRTIVVPNNSTKIQDAIDSAGPGDTVFVKTGVYEEQLLINKSLLLIGENNVTTVIESLLDEDTIIVTADNVTVSGFTIKNKVNTTPLSWGIKLSNSHNTTISNNIITGKFQGVGLVGGSSNIVEHNLITGNHYGIFTSNFISGNVASYSRNNVIFDNVVSDSFWNGIELDWGGGNIVCANNIINNTAYGLEIPIYAPSLDNIIFHNNIVDNVHTVIEGSSIGYQAYGPLPNSWDYGGEGNYWSNYLGKDEDHDGIGDTPMTTMYGTIDHYPLMGNFSDVTISPFTFGLVSNSLITRSALSLNGTKATLSMSIFQEANSTGFCRVSILKAMMAEPYEVKFDGEVITYPQVKELPSFNTSYECLYVDCPAGEHNIEISGTETVSEFLLPIFSIFFGTATLLAFVLCRRRHETSEESQQLRQGHTEKPRICVRAGTSENTGRKAESDGAILYFEMRKLLGVFKTFEKVSKLILIPIGALLISVSLHVFSCTIALPRQLPELTVVR
jgi:parallel beta-helix repeat protein